MKVVLTSGYSDNNIEVRNLSLPNHAEYCQRHGYDLRSFKERYSPHLNTKRIKVLLRHYDVVVNIGTDIIIQRMDEPIDRYIGGDGFTMCREYFGESHVLNGDFIIITKCKETADILHVLRAKQKRYSSAQSCINHEGLHIHESPFLQIAAPILNQRFDYSRVDVSKYFSRHYHTIGYLPIVANKAAAMKTDLKG